MAADGADDEQGAKAETIKSADPTRAADTRRDSERTEWTASDSRGPLSAAGPDDEYSDTAHPAAPDEAPTHEPATPRAAADDHPDPVARPEAAATPTVEAASPASAERPRRALPILAGLIVGALIGAGSAALVYQYEQGDASAEDQKVAALNARIDALEKKPDPQASIDALKASVADLAGKVAAAQKSASRQPAFDAAPLQRQVAALQSKIDAMQGQGGDVKDLDGKVAALAAAVATLKQQGADVKGLDGKVTALGTTVAGMQKQGATTQTSIDTLQSNQKSLEGKITSAPSLAVVADSLVQQIDRGEPYADQVAALTALGADPAKIAVLRENADKGVPSAKVLAARFEPLANPIAATAHKAPPNAGIMDRLKSGMFSMVSIRRADDTAGDDVESRVSRIEADLAHDDVAGAYTTWDGLPADGKAKSDAWGALAKTHAEAMNAARALQQQAIASLGAKKS